MVERDRGLAPAIETWHYCRQCRSKLAAVVESEASAFCSRDCYRRFCLVCEEPKSKQARSPYCSHTCKPQAQRNPAIVRHFRQSSEIHFRAWCRRS
jgi:hypothetical protein